MSKAIGIPKKAVGAGGKELTLSSSVGGTVYGTSLGGTRYKYDHAALLKIKNSPLSKSPATVNSIPKIPGITKVGSPALHPSAKQTASDAKASPVVTPATAPANVPAVSVGASAKPPASAAPAANGKPKSKTDSDDGLFDMDS